MEIRKGIMSSGIRENENCFFSKEISALYDGMIRIQFTVLCKIGLHDNRGAGSLIFIISLCISCCVHLQLNACVL